MTKKRLLAACMVIEAGLIAVDIYWFVHERRTAAL